MVDPSNYEPTAEDWAELRRLQALGAMTPHQRDAFASMKRKEEQHEKWADENRDYILDHPELMDEE